ncbi:hypothetical protein HK096_009061, partial [Nowakowskiella sp. JEL0078]
MLEFALRQERSKYVQLQQHLKNQTPESETGDKAAELISTDSVDSPASAEPLPVITSNLLASNVQGTLLGFSKGSGHLRSKEILKSYLREVGYLLSSTSGPYSNTYGPPYSNAPAAFRTDSPQAEEQSGVELNTIESLVAVPIPKIDVITPNGKSQSGVKINQHESTEAHPQINGVFLEEIYRMTENPDSKEGIPLKTENDPNNPWFPNHTSSTIRRQKITPEQNSK